MYHRKSQKGFYVSTLLDYLMNDYTILLSKPLQLTKHTDTDTKKNIKSIKIKNSIQTQIYLSCQSNLHLQAPNKTTRFIIIHPQPLIAQELCPRHEFQKKDLGLYA